MDVVIALVFVSLILVMAALVFFFSRLREGDFEHGDRLSLLPLLEDEEMVGATPKSDTAAGCQMPVHARGAGQHLAKEEEAPHGSV